MTRGRGLRFADGDAQPDGREGAPAFDVAAASFPCRANPRVL